MEPELWAELSQAVSQVQRRVPRRPRDTHPTVLIVRVHLWSVLHDRPTSWACQARHWPGPSCPPQLPDQSTLSRRMRREDFDAFLTLVQRRLNGGSPAAAAAAARLLKVADGKPLELPNHSRDPDARWGRGVSRTSLGYKLHGVRSGNPVPEFVVTPLDACEKRMAFRLVRRVGGTGYLLADAHYDASWLFDACRHHGHRLLCPRAKPGRGLGHRYQSPDRLRAIDQLEPPPGRLGGFGPELYRRRGDIERDFAQLTCFGGGLGPLPAWVRRIWRVRRWVWAKLLINGARIRINRRKQVA